MLTPFRNAAMNPLFSLWDYGAGPWTVTGYTATRWKLLRTGTPTIAARQYTVGSEVSIEKWLRGMPALLVDVPALGGGENVQVRQYQEAGNRHGRGLVNMKVMIAGPTGGTVTVGFNGITRTISTVGVGGTLSAVGTAQSGGASTIQLANSESSTDSALVGRWIELVGGTGQRQIRKITAYTGASRTATVDAPWLAQPDATTTYKYGTYWMPQYVEFMATMDDPAQEYVTIDPLSAPSQGSWMIAAVQLEYVHNAPYGSPWEIRTVQQERMLCARYVWPLPVGLQGIASSTSNLALAGSFPVAMRTTPTFRNLVSTGINAILLSSGSATASGAATFSASGAGSPTEGFRLVIQGYAAALTANAAYCLGSPGVGIFEADY